MQLQEIVDALLHGKDAHYAPELLEALEGNIAYARLRGNYRELARGMHNLTIVLHEVFGEEVDLPLRALLAHVFEQVPQSHFFISTLMLHLRPDLVHLLKGVTVTEHESEL